MSGREFFYAEDPSLTSGSTTDLKCFVTITQAQGGFESESEEWIAMGSVLLQNDGVGRGYTYLESQIYGAVNNYFRYTTKDITDFMLNISVAVVYPEMFVDLEITQAIRVGIQTNS